MNTNNISLRVRVYGMIRKFDVELSETFLARCHDIKDIVDLNTFFHNTLSQYRVDTYALRQSLNDQHTFEEWCAYFEGTLLPFLRMHRFPTLTARNPVSFYNGFPQPSTQLV